MDVQQLLDGDELVQVNPAVPSTSESHTPAHGPTGDEFVLRPFLATWDVDVAISGWGNDPLPLEKRAAILTGLAELQPHVLAIRTSLAPRSGVTALVREATALGLRCCIMPANAGALTRSVARRLRGAGAQMVAIHVDTLATGRRRREHGRAVGVTLRALQAAAAAQLPLQVCTQLDAEHLTALPWTARLVSLLGARLWSITYPVTFAPHRAGAFSRRFEESIAWVADNADRFPAAIEVSGAPQLHRVRRKLAIAHARRSVGPAHDELSDSEAEAASALREGNGTLHIDAGGAVRPSPLMPVEAGNVACIPLTALYRETTVFRQLRDNALIEGLCGDCRFTPLCGGSRARAYALTGSYLSSDPLCARVAGSNPS